MRVRVTLTIGGPQEKVLEGDAVAFEKGYKPKEPLEKMGIWLTDWRYCQVGGGARHDSQVFCPWGSVLMVETVKG